MKEKIKKIFKIVVYIFIWFIFVFSLTGIYSAILNISEIRRWEMVLLVVLLLILSSFLLRNQLRIIIRIFKNFCKNLKNNKNMRIFLKDNWFQVIIALAIILVAISVFYYFVIFIPQKEQARIDQQKQEQLAKDQKEQEAKQQAEQALNTCLADASTSYSDQWYRECKSQGKLTNRCIALHDMTLEEYAKEKNITADKQFTVWGDFYKEKNGCSCRLPLDNADRINKSLQDDKDECFKKYPQK